MEILTSGFSVTKIRSVSLKQTLLKLRTPISTSMDTSNEIHQTTLRMIRSLIQVAELLKITTSSLPDHNRGGGMDVQC